MVEASQACERCGTQVDFTAVGLCPGCKTSWFPGGEVHPRETIRQPATVEATREPGTFTLRWRWKNATGLAALAIVLVVGLIILFAFKSSLPLAVFGPVFAYWGVAQYVNSTSIAVGGGWVRARSGPLPIPLRPGLQLRASEIRQLYTSKVIKRGPRDSRWPSTSGSTWVSYDLSACLAPDGHRVKLVEGSLTPDVPLYLERELERELGIADAPMPEELRRR